MVNRKIIEKVRKYATLVRKRLPVKKVILFGSYARGTATTESDIDVAVVVERYPNEDILDLGTELFTLRRSVDLRIEPILLAEDEDSSGFLKDIKSYGQVID